MNQSTGYENNRPYIFISYAHFDSDLVLSIVFDLMDRGFRVWYDAGIEAGTEWPEYIAEQLDGCSVFLAFISRFSLDSQNCLRELNFAAQLGKKPVVVYLETSKLPEKLPAGMDGAPSLNYTRFVSHEDFIDELCRFEVLSCCKGEGAARRESTPEDDCFKAKECFETGRREDGVALYLRAAKKGSVEAQRRLGECYSYGNGVAKSYTEAAKWYRKAAEAGDAIAQKELGNFYYNGHGVPQNLYEAVNWYRKSAERGYCEGQYLLAACYKDGEGVAQSYSEAIKWYTKAADQGDSYAKSALQVLTDQGFGGSSNHSDNSSEKSNGNWLSRLFRR